MQSIPTNGSQHSTREKLKSVRSIIEQLETDLEAQQIEIVQLREERDSYRRMLVEQLKPQFGDPKEWDQFNAKDYTLTIDDLLAVLDSK